MDEYKALHGSCQSWNLSADESLKMALSKFSSSVNERANKCIKNVYDLSYDIDETEVALKNTFNEFLLLGNTQFIENRVYDDDDDDDGNDNGHENEERNGNTRRPRAGGSTVDPMVMLKEAFTAGQLALKLFYHEDTLNLEENEEDIYNARPLPFVIGTRSFKDAFNVGLGGPEDDMGDNDDDNDNDANTISRGDYEGEEEEEEQEEVNESNLEDEGISKPTRSGFPPMRQFHNKPNEAANHSVLATNNDESVNPEGSAGTTPAILPDNSMPLAVSLMSQIRTRSKGGVPESDDIDFKPANSVPAETARIGPPIIVPRLPSSLPSQPLIIAEQEDEGEEEDDGDLFGTEEDPYSLFSSKSRVSVKQESKRLAQTSLSDLFGNLDVSSKRSDSISSMDSALFGPGFGSGERAGQAQVQGQATKRSSFSSLFGDTNDSNLFDEVQPTLPIAIESKASSGVTAVNNKEPPVENKLFMNDEESSASQTVSERKNSMKKIETSELFGSGGLFGDEPKTDDFFLTNSTSKSINNKKEEAKRSTKVSILFGDDDDDPTSLFSSKEEESAIAKSSSMASSNVNQPEKSSARRSSLFDDEDDGGGLFGDTKQSFRSQVSVSIKGRGLKSLFGNDVEEGFSSTPKATPILSKVSIFDDEEKISGSFILDQSSKVSKKEPKGSEPPVTFPTHTMPLEPNSSSSRPIKPAFQRKGSLFDEENERDMEDERLFGEKLAASNITTPSNEAQSTSNSSGISSAASSTPSKRSDIKETPIEINLDAAFPSAKSASQDKGDSSLKSQTPTPIQTSPRPSISSFPFPLPPTRRASAQSSDSDEEEEDWNSDLPKAPNLAQQSLNTSIHTSTLKIEDNIISNQETILAILVPQDSHDLPPTEAKVTVGKVSTGLASRLQQLDGGKLGLFGAAGGFKIGGNRNDEAPSTLVSQESSDKVYEDLTKASLSRATVKTSGRRQPKKKSFLAEEEERPLTLPPAPMQSPPTVPSKEFQSKTNTSSSQSPLNETEYPANLLATAKPLKTQTRSLFGDDDEEDEVRPLPVVTSTHNQSFIGGSNSMGTNKGSLESLVPPEPSSITSNTMPDKMSSLVDDSNILFSNTNVSSAPVSAKDLLSSSKSNISNDAGETKAKGSLFDDEDTMIFSSGKVDNKAALGTMNNSTKKTFSSLFGDDDNDDGDIFSKRHLVSQQAATRKPLTSVKKSSLFGDDDDEEYPLLKLSQPSTRKTKGLFDD